MTEQLQKLKQHLMNTDALIQGNAARIQEELREALFTEVRSGLAIIVASEAISPSLERRALLPEGSGDVAAETAQQAAETTTEGATGAQDGAGEAQQTEGEQNG